MKGPGDMTEYLDMQEAKFAALERELARSRDERDGLLDALNEARAYRNQAGVERDQARDDLRRCMELRLAEIKSRNARIATLRTALADLMGAMPVKYLSSGAVVQAEKALEAEKALLAEWLEGPAAPWWGRKEEK
jgi:hypothetical protein